jgi:hypothetical protein
MLYQLVKHLGPAYPAGCNNNQELDRQSTELACFCRCKAGGSLCLPCSGMACSCKPPGAGSAADKELLTWAWHPDAPVLVLQARRALQTQAVWPLVPRSVTDHTMCQSVGQAAVRCRQALVLHLAVHNDGALPKWCCCISRVQQAIVRTRTKPGLSTPRAEQSPSHQAAFLVCMRPWLRLIVTGAG